MIDFSRPKRINWLGGILTIWKIYVIIHKSEYALVCTCEQHRDYGNPTRMVVPFGVTLTSGFEGFLILGGGIDD